MAIRLFVNNQNVNESSLSLEKLWRHFQFDLIILKWLIDFVKTFSSHKSTIYLLNMILFARELGDASQYIVVDNDVLYGIIHGIIIATITYIDGKFLN